MKENFIYKKKKNVTVFFYRSEGSFKSNSVILGPSVKTSKIVG